MRIASLMRGEMGAAFLYQQHFTRYGERLAHPLKTRTRKWRRLNRGQLGSRNALGMAKIAAFSARKGKIHEAKPVTFYLFYTQLFFTASMVTAARAKPLQRLIFTTFLSVERPVHICGIS